MISVIIPSFNNCQLLEKAIYSVINQSIHKNKYEIIVVDNASSDKTQIKTEQIITDNKNVKIRYFLEEIPGLLSGRHRGAKESVGDILVFIDDDIEANSGWLSAINDSFYNNDIHLVGGKCLPKYEVQPPYWVEYLWRVDKNLRQCGYYSLIDLGDEIKEINPGFIYGLNFSIRKKTLYELGGFHPDVIPKKYQRYQGDGETGLTLKTSEKGYKAIYNPKALVYHWVSRKRMTIKYIQKRMFYQGVCDSYTQIRYAHLKKDINSNDFYLKHFISRIKKIIDPTIVKNKIRHLVRQRTLPMDIINLFVEMQNSYLEGYNFHQSEVKNDPGLMVWVLKEDYFNYQYPF